MFAHSMTSKKYLLYKRKKEIYELSKRESGNVVHISSLPGYGVLSFFWRKSAYDFVDFLVHYKTNLLVNSSLRNNGCRFLHHQSFSYAFAKPRTLRFRHFMKRRL